MIPKKSKCEIQISFKLSNVFHIVKIESLIFNEHYQFDENSYDFTNDFTIFALKFTLQNLHKFDWSFISQ